MVRGLSKARASDIRRFVDMMRKPEVCKELGRDFEGLNGIVDKYGKDENVGLVMLGESTHGTHEFYSVRSEISKRLIEQHGYRFIGVEADWPACQFLNQYIQTGKGSINDVLQTFKRWPTWMWSNSEIADLIEWIKEYNLNIGEKEEKVGFYGIDIYSLYESIEEAVKALKIIDPELSERARENYDCFLQFSGDEYMYARSLSVWPEGCRREAAMVLKSALESELDQNPLILNAQQNARIVASAEEYYRAMLSGDISSWNIRDRHMLDTIETLLRFYNGKGIIWAHNTHIGDYKATNMAKMDEVNIGGLAREKWGSEFVKLLGFSTFSGKVIASNSGWDGMGTIINIPESPTGTFEEAFKRISEARGIDDFILDFKCISSEEDEHVKNLVLGQRAIGVVYKPQWEVPGNYVPTCLVNRYDALIFIKRTTAVNWIQFGPAEILHHLPESFPSGQ